MWFLFQGDRKEACRILQNLGEATFKPGIVSALVTLYLADGSRDSASKVLKDAVDWYRKNQVCLPLLKSNWFIGLRTLLGDRLYRCSSISTGQCWDSIFISDFFFLEDGVGLVPKCGCLLNVSILRIPQMIRVWRAMVEWYWQGKTELGEKPVPVPLYPPQIPHGLTRARTRAPAVRGRWLKTRTMARPLYQTLKYCLLFGTVPR
jgi:hypothetical protein